jgi:hypothetical protein
MLLYMNMNLTDTVSPEGSFMGLLIARHFTKHEFGDQLPPTYLEDLNHPAVKQARAVIAFQILQTLVQVEQRKMLQANPKKARKAMQQAMAQGLR